MTNGEIVKSYLAAKDKKKQIGILAELNLCSTEQIKEILIECGVDSRQMPRNRKPVAEEHTPATVSTKPMTEAAETENPCENDTPVRDRAEPDERPDPDKAVILCSREDKTVILKALYMYTEKGHPIIDELKKALDETTQAVRRAERLIEEMEAE